MNNKELRDCFMSGTPVLYQGSGPWKLTVLNHSVSGYLVYLSIKGHSLDASQASLIVGVADAKDFNVVGAVSKVEEQPLISAEEARKLGAGNAEYRYRNVLGNWEWQEWIVCSGSFEKSTPTWEVQYRAIKQPEPVEVGMRDAVYKDSTPNLHVGNSAFEDWFQAQPFATQLGVKQMCRDSYAAGMGDPLVTYATAKPEPVEPHAELKAMYEQQVKDGTLDDFVWEWCYQGGVWQIGFAAPKNSPDYKYRCTPKPTCQVRNEDTGELKTMTREKARLLQAETKDVCDWFEPENDTPYNGIFIFNADGIYTYKQKPNLVKLNGKLMTRKAAIAEWESKKDTCDVWYSNKKSPRWGISELPNFDEHNSSSSFGEYELRERPLKQISWKDVPVGVMTNKGELRNVFGIKAITETSEKSKHGYTSLEHLTCTLELAPADQQPWIAVQDGQTGYGVTQMLHSKGIWTALHESGAKYRITGISNGWKL